MQKQLAGKAWRFDGILDVDYEIFPWKIRHQLSTDEDYGAYCMTALDPDFPKKVNKGDVIVGGEGFGYGHDHDAGSRAIVGCGLSAVLCESATPYFLRNSFHHGLPVLEIPGIQEATTTGDAYEVDLENGTVLNTTTGWSATFAKLPEFVFEMLDAGNIYRIVVKDKPFPWEWRELSHFASALNDAAFMNSRNTIG